MMLNHDIHEITLAKHVNTASKSSDIIDIMHVIHI